MKSDLEDVEMKQEKELHIQQIQLQTQSSIREEDHEIVHEDAPEEDRKFPRN